MKRSKDLEMPGMPSRKLRKKMITLNAYTEGKIKYIVSKFLEKPTGILSHYEDANGEKVPQYHPYEGFIDTHPMWNGEDQSFSDIPRFGIFSYFYSLVIPIHYGDKVQVFGNRLVIWFKYDSDVADTPKFRYREFAHVTFPPEKIHSMKLEGRFDTEFMNVFELAEYTDRRLRTNEECSSYSECCNRIMDTILANVTALIPYGCNEETVSFQIEPIHDVDGTDMNQPIDVEIDVKKFLDRKCPLEDCITYSQDFNGERDVTHHLNSAIKTSLNDWCDKIDNYHADSDYDEMNEYWGDPFDDRFYDDGLPDCIDPEDFFDD